MSRAGNLSEQRVGPVPVPPRPRGPARFAGAVRTSDGRVRSMALGDAGMVLMRVTEPSPLSGEQMDEIGW
jgi:hypothetical protein